MTTTHPHALGAASLALLALVALASLTACGGKDSGAATAPPADDSGVPPDASASNGGVVLLELGTAWRFDGTQWTAEPTAANPPELVTASLAPLGDQLVLFGGWSPLAQNVDNDTTLTFEGTAWTPLAIAGPGARGGMAMATLGSELVRVGGVGGAGSPILGDTWSFDGTGWGQVSAAGPSARWGHAMASLGNTVVLFGGLDAQENNLGDTWTFDGTSWTQVNVPGPAPREAHAMATLGDKVFLFGGRSQGYSEDGGFEVTSFGDTWSFDGSTWSQVNALGPGARSEHAMATLGDRIVLFGGVTDATPTSSDPTELADTWTFDGVSWTSVGGVSPPAAVEDGELLMARLPGGGGE